MSTHSERATDERDVEERIDALTERIAERAEHVRRKRQVVIGIGTALVVLMMFSLSGVTRMAKQLDAAAIAQIGRHEVQKKLPSGRQAVQSYLVQEAPRIVQNALLSMIDLIPELRRMVVADIMNRLDTVHSVFEEKLLVQTTSAIHESKTAIDKAWPNLSDREKLEKLVEQVSKDFRESFTQAIEELYPSYSHEMSRITAYLDTLHDTDPAKLTPDQVKHKRIIETMLLLVRRSHQDR